MLKRPLMVCILLIVTLTSSHAKEQVKAPVESKPLHSLVKVFSMNSKPDFFQPWQNHGQSSGTGSGFVIAGKLILTNAHVVANQTFLLVRKQGDTKKYVAKLVAVGHECDLALLTVEDSAFFKNLPYLEMGNLPKLRETVSVLGYPIGGDNVSITEGVVSRIEPTVYSHSRRELLAIQIDAAINPGNSGGPVINKNKKVIGMAFQGLSKSQNIGYMIPVSIINHFLKDITDGQFDGFPTFPFLIMKMENPDMRKWAKMDKMQSGVLVCSIPPIMKASSPFKENDVLLEVDGKKIANDATIKFRSDEVIFFENSIWSKFIGDTATFKLLRNGKQIEVKYKLSRDKRLVPRRFFDRLPTYYIVGGLVFVPLTVNYLDSWRDWWTTGPRDLVNYVNDGRITEKLNEIVVLSFVLADRSTVGYQYVKYQPIVKANGIKLKNLQHLIDIIEKQQDKYLILQYRNKVKLVIDLEEQRKATAEILKRYRIPNDRSRNLESMEKMFTPAK
jgi:S1-C subfamily serine protease